MGVPVLWAPHSLHLGCVGHMADFPLGGGALQPLLLNFRLAWIGDYLGGGYGMGGGYWGNGPCGPPPYFGGVGCPTPTLDFFPN